MGSFPKLSYACPIPWADLQGNERERYCQQCGRSVTNLSELSETERTAILAASGQGEVCVSFYRRITGEYVTPDAPLTSEERSSIRQLGVAALSAGALLLAAGCVASPAQKTPAKPSAETSQIPKTTAASEKEEVVVLQAFGVVADPVNKK